jgi:L-asparaginase
MRPRHARTALFLLVGCPLAAVAQARKPVVEIVGTGGTIGSTGDYWGGRPTRVPIAELARVPGIDSVATVESEQLWNVASSSIGPSRWLELSRHVTAMLATRRDLAGVVITHGTDTMEETAFFLDLTVESDRPVVVTGSMRPSNMAGADGPANLMNAVRVAADPRSRGRGTMVLMDDRLYSARDVTKTNSTRVETFQAPERGPVAIVDPEGVIFHVPSEGRRAPAFPLGTLTALPRVDIVYAYPGADGTAIDAFVAAGARGLVVAGVGRGGTTSEQRAALDRAMRRGVVVVIGTRTGSGRVPDEAGGTMVGAGDLNPQKARVLLSLALTRTTDAPAVARLFAEHQ